LNRSLFLRSIFLAACLVMASGVLPVGAQVPTPTASPTTSPAPSNQTSGTPAPQNASGQPQPPTTTNANQQREIDAHSLTSDKTVGELQAEYAKTCFYCAITGRIFAAAMLLGERVFAVIAPGVAQFLMAMLGLWILWQAGKLFFPFMPFDRGSATGNTVLTRILFGIAASAILLMPGGYKIYWNYLYMPIVDGAVSMSSALLKEGTPKGSLLAEVSNVNQCKPTQVLGLTAAQARIKDDLECQVYNLQKAFTYGLALGVYLFQSGALVTGALLVIAYIAAPLAFILLILGALLHWTFLSVLSPVLLGAAVFPKTRTYTISAIKQMIGSGMSLITASIVAVISAGMVLYSIQSAYQALGAESVPSWLRNFVVQNPYSKTNNVPLDGSGATKAGQDLYKDQKKSGLLPLPYRDGLLAGVTIKFKSPPAPGTCWKTVTSPFGWRWGRMHEGIDLGCPFGTPFLAVLPGRVIYSGWTKNGCGFLVKVDHGNGIATGNCHNSTVNAIPNGSWVEAGQPLSRVGKTGGITGPHHHFMLWINGKRVNPHRYLFNNLPIVSNGNYNYADGSSGGGAVSFAAAVYADLVAPLNLALQATWQILLAAIIPWMLARSVPQTLTSALGLPKIPAAEVPGQVVGGLIQSGMGVALTAVATLGAMLQKAGDAPPEQKKTSTEDTSALATVPRAADSIATADGANRDPQLAAAYSHTIDIQAVSVADDDRMPVMATEKMTDSADDQEQDAQQEKEAKQQQAQTKATLSENIAYYTGSALLGLAGGVSAIGRIFGANITYEQFEFGQNNKSANDKTQQSEDKKSAAPTMLDRISGTVENAGSRALPQSSAVAEASDADSAASQGESDDDARGPRRSSGRDRETPQIAAVSRVLESAASSERDQQEDPSLDPLRKFVTDQQMNLTTLIKAAEANDPDGRIATELSQAKALAGASLSNRDLGDLYSLLGAMKNLEAPLERTINNLQPTPTGGGSRR
jgi:murein DD-endopeptidase MepM/ murein hydrolase activator NlpD